MDGIVLLWKIKMTKIVVTVAGTLGRALDGNKTNIKEIGIKNINRVTKLYIYRIQRIMKKVLDSIVS